MEDLAGDLKGERERDYRVKITDSEIFVNGRQGEDGGGEQEQRADHPLLPYSESF